MLMIRDPLILLAPTEGAQYFPALRHSGHSFCSAECSWQSSSCCRKLPAHAVGNTPTQPRGLAWGRWIFVASATSRTLMLGSEPSPKTIKPSLTAQRHWNFFSTTARILCLFFFLILFLTLDKLMPSSLPPQPCPESSLKLSLLKFSKKIQPEAETCEVSVQMVKGWRSFKQLKTGAYNQKCQAALIILFPEGNSFPCRSPGVIKKS